LAHERAAPGVPRAPRKRQRVPAVRATATRTWLTEPARLRVAAPAAQPRSLAVPRSSRRPLRRLDVLRLSTDRGLLPSAHSASGLSSYFSEYRPPVMSEAST